MKKLKKNLGMTMAEMLIVVAIIAVLGGVASVAVWNYQRSLGQLERDGIAKEIFVAAQNHLTAAHGQGYLGLSGSDFGTEDTTSTIVGDYYYVVNGGASGAGVFKQMLPFGSVDETVRAGGSYIIHYQKNTGLVLDVFYCTRSGSPTQYNVSSLENGDYSLAMNARSSKENRKTGVWRNANNGPILGYYGGVDGAVLPQINKPLEPPTINVVNAEKLYVEVNNPNTDVEDTARQSITVSIRLLIKGLSSGTEHYINVTGDSQTIILDDITSSSNSNGHFGYRRFDDMPTTQPDNGFIPGENIEIQAVAFSTGALANIAYSNKVTTNSLFESIANLLDETEAPISASSEDKIFETAYICNIRHLENLDQHVSNLGLKVIPDPDGGKSELFLISSAKQTTDLSWKTFKSKIDSTPVAIYYSSDFGFSELGSKYILTDSTKLTCFYPISPEYTLTYDGQNHSISDVAVDIVGDAGLFGSTTDVSEIKNLELIGFAITGTTSAGALAGTLNGCTVTNVLARNSEGASTAKITASGTDSNAGGLIGNLTSGTVQFSAAAVLVGDSTKKPTNAGGLIGNASGTINGCYSGGHTKNGSYVEWVKNNAHPYDVTGGTVGGLVGTSSATISNSYSTCSVSGTTAGGLVGSSSVSITNCYATGLVKGTTAQYAFLGSGIATLSNNYYYRVINNVSSTNANAREDETEPMLPVNGYAMNNENLQKIKPIDLNVDTYNAFVGSYDDWNSARAFDSALVQYYSGKYPLKSVFRSDWTANYVNATNKTTLSPPSPTTSGLITNSTEVLGKIKFSDLFVRTHYGDWPSPEVFFINN